MNMFDQKPPKDAGFFVLMILDPNQNVPVLLGWGPRPELRDEADKYISENPRCRAYLLKTISEISAIASLRERDPDTGVESKRGATT